MSSGIQSQRTSRCLLSWCQRPEASSPAPILSSSSLLSLIFSSLSWLGCLLRLSMVLQVCDLYEVVWCLLTIVKCISLHVLLYCNTSGAVDILIQVSITGDVGWLFKHCVVGIYILSDPGLLATFTLGETVLKELPDLTSAIDKYQDDLPLQNALYRDYSFLASAYLLEPCHERFLKGESYGLGRQTLPSVISMPISRCAKL